MLCKSQGFFVSQQKQGLTWISMECLWAQVKKGWCSCREYRGINSSWKHFCMTTKLCVLSNRNKAKKEECIPGCWGFYWTILHIPMPHLLHDTSYLVLHKVRKWLHKKLESVWRTFHHITINLYYSISERSQLTGMFVCARHGVTVHALDSLDNADGVESITEAKEVKRLVQD